jgi:hypothetical protein
MRYIVKEDDGFNWAKWEVEANSKKDVLDWLESMDFDGLTEDNAYLLEHSLVMPYGGKIEIESEVE